MARLGIVVVFVLATLSLFAEGILKQGWMEAFFLAPAVLFLLKDTTVILQNVLLVLSSICLTLSGVDLAVRPLIHDQLHYTPLNAYSRTLPELPILGRWDPHLDVVSEIYGDMAAISGQPSFREWRPISFQTDDAGFRNRSRSDKIDLLTLGDSFGAGAGTTQDKTFSGVLERKYGLRTYNLSYPGGPYYEFVNFAIESPKLTFSPRALVVWTWYIGNDLVDPAGEIFDVGQLPWNNKLEAWLVKYRTFRNRSPMNQWWQAMQWRRTNPGGEVMARALPMRQPILFLPGHDWWGSQSKQAIEQHANFLKNERTLEAMKRLVAEKGLNLVVLVLPTKGEVYRWIVEGRDPSPEDAAPSGFALAVLAACGRVHVQCLDTKPYLVEQGRRLFASSGNLLWWRDDSHLGEYGHAAVAEFIASNILEDILEERLTPTEPEYE